MKNIFKLLLLLVLVVISQTKAFAQWEISGPSPAGQSRISKFIVYYNGASVASPRWTESSGKNIVTQNYSDRSEMTVTWPDIGRYTIRFYNGTTLLVTKIISVVCALPPQTTMTGAICGTAGSVTINANLGDQEGGVRWYTQQTGGISFSSAFTITVSSPGTYYVAMNGVNCESPRAAVTVTAMSGISSPNTDTAPTFCRGAVTLTATPGSGGDAVVWSGPNGTQQGNNYIVSSLTSNTSYSVYSRNSASGCFSPAITVNAGVKAAVDPLVRAYSTTVRGHGQVQLTGGMLLGAVVNDSDRIRWYSSAQGGALAGEVGILEAFTTPDLSAPVTYYGARVQAPDNCESPARIAVVAGILPLMSPNQVREDNTRIQGITTDAQWNALTADQKRGVVYHYDGLLRVNQQIAVKASPAGFDVVQPVEYDDKGRVSKQYLPYVSTTKDGSFQSTYVGKQADFYNSPPAGVQADALPYAVSVYEASPLARPLEQGSAGTAFQPGTGHTLRSAYSFNIAGDVRKFNSDGSSTGFYEADKLTKTTVIDQNGATTIQFTNDKGQVILNRRQWNESVNGSLVEYLDTYYVYDDFGRTKYVVSPKGVQALMAGGWSFTANIRQGYTYQFVYDNLGRLVEKKVPGQDWQYLAYDPLDRLVLVQDGVMRAQNKWSYTKYDQQGRPVMQGWYTHPSYTTRADIQQHVLNGLYAGANDIWYETPGTVLHGYSNNTFPNATAEVQTVNYYDTYDFDRNGSEDYAYTAQGLVNENIPGASIGLSTGDKRIIPGTTTWLVSYLFYDEYGRPIQTRSSNHLNPTVYNDLITRVYDFEGALRITKRYQDGGVGRTITVYSEFDYDAAGRIAEIRQRNNTDALQVVALYGYNELGQMITKKLHKNAVSGKFLQSVDYRYGLRGELVSINNAALAAGTNNPNDNAEHGDYFGMEFIYEKNDIDLGNTALYNGNISAMKWKAAGLGEGISDQRGYAFAYDKVNQLKAATYKANSGTSWNKELNAENESITYDANGNITTLQRNARKHTLNGTGISYTAGAIDNLTYSYDAVTGDRLKRVDDTASNPGGFANGASKADEYRYDTNGNTLADDNKGISNIVYSLLGKPAMITFTDGRKVEYVYDATGTKLTMKTYASGGSTPTLVTDYVNGFVYENNTLVFFASPEGRVVKKGTALEYQYGLGDHQGNTRVVFSSVTPAVDAPVASFEDDAGDGSESYKGTYKVVPFVAAATSGTHVIRMDQTNPVGPTRSIKVFPGDKIDISVSEYHEGSVNWGDSSPPINALITAIASSFGGVAGAPGESGAIFDGVDAALSLFGSGGSLGDDRPGAYLNYIQFDKDYNILDMGWLPAPDAPFSKNKIQFNTLDITEPGYVYVYLSYESESNGPVYFDDLTVAHRATNVVQYNEYYPFGLQASTSWTREDSKNDYLYNAGSELNATTGWYETPFRGYDAALGRFMQVDPMAQAVTRYSPYAYANCNPVLFNDPSGLLSRAEFFNVLNDLRSSTYGGTWSEDGGTSYYISGFDEFAGGAAYMDANGLWGGGNGRFASDFGAAAVTYSKATGDPLVLLREVTINEARSNDRWFQNRIDEAWGSSVKNAQQGVNLMISFVHNTQFVNTDGWKTAIASNLSDALAIAQSYSCDGGEINNLVLVSHGNPFGAVFGNRNAGGDYLSVNTIKGAGKDASAASMMNKFNSLLGQVAPGGNVVLTACQSGVELGEALIGNVRNDIGLHLNMYKCVGWVPGPGYISPVINSPLSMFGDGWRNVNGGFTSNTGITINSNGTLKID